MRVAVYTAITCRRNELLPPQVSPAGVDYYCFTDDKQTAAAGWTQRIMDRRWRSPQRTARYYKIMGPSLLPGYDAHVWVDGHITPTTDVRDIIEERMREADIAVFKHPLRDCPYEEAGVCWDQRSDDPSKLVDAVVRLHAEGVPRFAGLWETGVVIGRNTERIRHFATDWWKAVEMSTVRDQIHFVRISRRYGLRLAELGPGTVRNSPYFYWGPHRPEPEVYRELRQAWEQQWTHGDREKS